MDGGSCRRDQPRSGAGDPDTGKTYYRHWLAALERILAVKGVSDVATLTRYRDAWNRAAGRTPHGVPIVLTSDDFGSGR
jgi:hypothetical protein